jgi:hypothetical protein
MDSTFSALYVTTLHTQDLQKIPRFVTLINHTCRLAFENVYAALQYYKCILLLYTKGWLFYSL